MEAQIGYPLRSADKMVKKLVEDPARLEAIRQDPLVEISKLADEAKAETTEAIYTTDRFIYRVAIFVLSLLALTAAVGSLVLELGGRTTPEALVALGAAAGGALVGLFAKSPAA
jgi:hypothetical protein